MTDHCQQCEEMGGRGRPPFFSKGGVALCAPCAGVDPADLGEPPRSEEWALADPQGLRDLVEDRE